MKKPAIKTLLIIAGILIVAAGVVVYFYSNKIKADQIAAEPVISSDDVFMTPVAAEQATPDSRQEVAVPILMYHHVRNYNEPNDTIGTNLSVSPENFKAQIKYLKDNGFTTITFADFLGFPTKKLPDKPIILTFDDGYNDAYTSAYAELKQNGQVGVFYVISGFIGRSDSLTATQIKEMSDGGMEIGSHSIDHPDLTKITSLKLKNELQESKNSLEKISGKSITSFCYPSGAHNTAVDTAVKNAGYLSATTTSNSISTTSKNKFFLPRLRINPTDSLTKFASKITPK